MFVANISESTRFPRCELWNHLANFVYIYISTNVQESLFLALNSPFTKDPVFHVGVQNCSTDSQYKTGKWLGGHHNSSLTTATLAGRAAQPPGDQVRHRMKTTHGKQVLSWFAKVLCLRKCQVTGLRTSEDWSWVYCLGSGHEGDVYEMDWNGGFIPPWTMARQTPTLKQLSARSPAFRGVLKLQADLHRGQVGAPQTPLCSSFQSWPCVLALFGIRHLTPMELGTLSGRSVNFVHDVMWCGQVFCSPLLQRFGC